MENGEEKILSSIESELKVLLPDGGWEDLAETLLHWGKQQNSSRKDETSQKKKKEHFQKVLGKLEQTGIEIMRRWKKQQNSSRKDETSQKKKKQDLPS